MTEISVIQKYKNVRQSEFHFKSVIEVMKSARERSPFGVIEMTQDGMKSFGEHTSHYFKKTIKMGIGLSIYRMLGFWIILVFIQLQFGSSTVQKMSKFEIIKKLTRELSLRYSSKYSGMLPLKPGKVADAKVLINKIMSLKNFSCFMMASLGLKMYHQRVNVINWTVLFCGFCAFT